jgi:hypothetical protein
MIRSQTDAEWVSQYNVGTFPNLSTQFRGGERLGQPAPAGRQATGAQAEGGDGRESVRDPEPAFNGDALALLQSVYRDPAVPLDVRVACANAAARFERPSFGTTDAPPPGSQPNGRRIDVHALTAEQRAVLLVILRSGAVRPAASDGDTAIRTLISDATGTGIEGRRVVVSVIPMAMDE